MGYSLSWAAVRGKSADAILGELGLRRTGAREEPVFESKYGLTVLPGGWTLVLADHNERFVQDELLRMISKGAEAVACFVEEHVMMSQAVGWKDGAMRWSVVHDAQIELDHLAQDGEPPTQLTAELAAAHEQREADPDDADFFFDVPVNIAQELTGYRYDEGDYTYEVLASVPKTGWLSRLFGAR